MKKIINKIRAFTLIETLLSIVIASIILGMTSSFFLDMVLAKKTFLARQELNYNMQFLIQKIRSEVIEAGAVNADDSTLGMSPGRLSLTSDNPAKDPIIIESDGEKLTIKYAEDEVLDLISRKVKVDELTFSYLEPENSTGIIEGSITLESTVDNSLFETNNFSINLRNKST